MNSSNSTNAWFFLGAAIIGAVSAASVFLFEQYRQDKRRHALTKDLARLDNQLSTLRKELETLRALQKEKAQAKPNRKKLRQVNSAPSVTTTEDFRSAVEYDSSDLEFYDFSSDESDNETDQLLKRSPTPVTGTVADYKSFVEALSSEYYDYSEIDEALLSELREVDSNLDYEVESSAEVALEKLATLLAKHPHNGEVLWRVAKAHKILAATAGDSETKKEHVLKGIETCELAVQLRPKMGPCHKWLAILLGMRAEFAPIKERILDGYELKKHCDIAVELIPDDPVLHHMLGRFAYEIAQLSWLERTVAQTLYAEMPKLSHQDALKHFLQAEQCSEKDWKENRLYLAKCSLAIGEKESAIEWLSKAENSNSVEEDKVHEEVRSLLQKYR